MVAMVLGLTGVAPSSWTNFGAIAYGATVLWALLIMGVRRIPFWYALLHPLGAAVSTWIFLKAAYQGDQVTGYTPGGRGGVQGSSRRNEWRER